MTIYEALFEKSKELVNINISRSGFLLDELTDKGYVSIGKLADYNNNFDTEENRREIHLYKFDVYTLGLRGERQCENIINEIINLYDEKPLNLSPLVFEACFYDGDFIREEESGIWHGTVVFQIWCQRELI